MTENNQIPESLPVPPTPPTPPSRFGPRFPWFGIVLVVLGIVFFLNQFKVNLVQNWWALFILIPALGSLGASWRAWRSSGRFNAAARSSLGSGLVILTVALIFLLGLSWSTYWPLMLIVPGFSMLLGGIPEHELAEHKYLRRFVGLGFWFGIAGMLLGGAFLFKNLSPELFTKLFGSFRWYGVFVIIPAVGAIVNSFLLRRDNEGRFTVPAKVLLGVGLLMLVLAAFILSPLPWNILYAVLLVGAGLIVMLTAWLK
jgi:hypothetical protein